MAQNAARCKSFKGMYLVLECLKKVLTSVDIPLLHILRVMYIFKISFSIDVTLFFKDRIFWVMSNVLYHVVSQLGY